MFIKHKKKQKIKSRKTPTDNNKLLVKILLIVFLSFVIIMAASVGYIRLKHYFGSQVSSNFFTVKTIKIKGLFNISDKDILMNIGFNISDNMFYLNKRVAIKNVLTKFPEIETVEIKKYYPSRVIIKIKERQPVFNIFIGGKEFFIDRYGAVFNVGSKNVEIITLNQNANCSLNYLVKFVSLVKDKNPDFFNRIKKLDIDERKFIHIFLRDKTEIIWGRLDGKFIDNKIRFFLMVEQDLVSKGKNFSKIDLKYFRNEKDFIVVK